MSPHRAWSGRNRSGSSRSSQITRNAQRRPSRSSNAMIGTPVAEPRTGRPGSGRGRTSVARIPGRLPPVSLDDLADGLIALQTEHRTGRPPAAEIEARMDATYALSPRLDQEATG